MPKIADFRCFFSSLIFYCKTLLIVTDVPGALSAQLFSTKYAFGIFEEAKLFDLHSRGNIVYKCSLFT